MGIKKNHGNDIGEVPTCQSDREELDEDLHTMWMAADGGQRFYSCERSIPQIPPGQYDMEYDHSRAEPYFEIKEPITDDLIILPDSASEEVIAAVDDFWTKKDLFHKYGFLWKRGVLLWGPAGSGKTCTVEIIAQNIVAAGGVAMYMKDPNFGSFALDAFREVEPDRPMVVMLEDIDSIIDAYGDSAILNLLDGADQIENVLFIATTNYPEKLDKRIRNRPSRFDIVKLIDMPSPAAREEFLRVKDHHRFGGGNNKPQLKQWVDATEGFSVAHLKEVIISVEVFGVSFDATIRRLRLMMDNNPSSEQISKDLGLTDK